MRGCRRLDAVLMTHAHADHLHGIDDIRQVNRLMRPRSRSGPTARPWPKSAAVSATRWSRRASPAAFTSRRSNPYGSPAPFAIPACRWCRSRRTMGYSTTTGFRIGPIAYSTDVTELDDEAFAAVAGVELWVVDCMRRAPHPTHSHLAKTLGWIERVARAAPS